VRTNESAVFFSAYPFHLQCSSHTKHKPPRVNNEHTLYYHKPWYYSQYSDYCTNYTTVQSRFNTTQAESFSSSALSKSDSGFAGCSQKYVLGFFPLLKD